MADTRVSPPFGRQLSFMHLCIVVTQPVLFFDKNHHVFYFDCVKVPV